MRYPVAVASVVLLILASRYADATSFTAVRSGDWNDPATWGLNGSPTCHVSIPCMTDAYSTGPANGDTVTISDTYTITCGAPGFAHELCSVGNSPSASTLVLTITHATGVGGFRGYSGSTLIYAGAAQLAAGTWQFDAGFKIQHDSSWATTPVSYTFQTQSSSFKTSVVINGTPTSPVVWDGDSYYSPTSCRLTGQGCNTNCASPSSAGCRSGYVGQSGTQSADCLPISGSYLTVQNVGGTFTQSVTTLPSHIVGLRMVNSQGHVININGNATADYTCDNCMWSSCTGSRCIQIFDPPNGIASGTYYLRNSIISGQAGIGTSTFSGWKWMNVMFQTDAIGHVGVGPISVTHNALGYNLFYYDNRYTTGTAQPTNYMQIPPNTSNSVIWVEKTIPGFHIGAAKITLTNAAAGTTTFKNNVLGFIGAWRVGNQYGITAQGTPSNTGSFVITGNVVLCGYDGNSSVNVGVNSLMNANIPLTMTQNVACTHGYSFAGDQAPLGLVNLEGTVRAGTIASINSNLFFNGNNALVAEVLGSTNSGYASVISEVTNNAVVNTNSTTVVGSGNSGANWITSGPANDIVRTANALPQLPDPLRSVPLFNRYLNASGLLPDTTYSSDAQYKGLWQTNGTGYSYNIGDVVSYSQSGVFRVSTTYWRCILAHMSSSLNEPIRGNDPSNPYWGQEAYWEPAWLAWFRTQVLAGTTYNDGAIGASSTHTNFQDTTDTGVIGVLNGWLRQGFIGLDPQFWAAGKGGVEIGLPTARSQHIPPPAAVN